MQIFLYALFGTVLTLNPIKEIGVGRGLLALLPEVFSAISLVLMAAFASRTKRLFLPAKYIMIFALLAVTLVFGAISNNASAGAFLTGLRNYLKFLPFFLLAIAYPITELNIAKLLRFILFFGLLQLLVVIYQRFFLYAHIASGDPIVGTLEGSGLLTLFLVSTMLIAYCFFLRSLITLQLFAGISLILLTPTMLNETKVSFVLIPIALVLPLLLDNTGERFYRLVFVTFAGGLFLVTFATVYDILQTNKEPVLEVFTNPDRLLRILAPHTAGIRTEGPVGRGDAVLLALKGISKDWPTMMFGLGIGNVSDSASLGERFEGEYHAAYGELIYAAYSKLIWEIGLLGVFLLLVFSAFVFRDSLFLARFNNMTGAFALGWASVVCIVVLMLAYSNIIASNALSTLYWFFSGFIVANAHQLRGRGACAQSFV